MRPVWGLVSLLVALLVAGFLARNQLAAISTAPVGSQDQLTGIPVAPSGSEPLAQTKVQQLRQIQDQVRQSVEAGMKRPDRPSDE